MKIAEMKNTVKLLGLEKVAYGIKNARRLDGSQTIQLYESQVADLLADMVRKGSLKYGPYYRINAILKHKDESYSIGFNDFEGICITEKIDNITILRKLTKSMKKQSYILLVEQNNGLYELAV